MATQSTAAVTNNRKRSFAIAANRFVYWFSRKWILIFSVILVIFVSLPFAAPFFMYIGWTRLGLGIYHLYAILCHQLPQRSIFLFGQSISHSLSEIQTMWINTHEPAVLRQFIGNLQFGWKMAWSDRMFAMYTSIPFIAWYWWPLRKRVKPLGLRGFILLLLPMLIDGTTHMLSDLAGIGQGFRDTNLWLVALTGNSLSPAFYAGDALGSFNSWGRLITGFLFGLAVVWYGFPILDKYFDEKANLIERKFKRAGIPL